MFSFYYLIAADVMLWKRQYVSPAILLVATVAWLLFERAGLSFLTISSDVLLILIVLLFLRANYAEFRNLYVLKPIYHLFHIHTYICMYGFCLI